MKQDFLARFKDRISKVSRSGQLQELEQKFKSLSVRSASQRDSRASSRSCKQPLAESVVTAEHKSRSAKLIHSSKKALSQNFKYPPIILRSEGYQLQRAKDGERERYGSVSDVDKRSRFRGDKRPGKEAPSKVVSSHVIRDPAEFKQFLQNKIKLSQMRQEQNYFSQRPKENAYKVDYTVPKKELGESESPAKDRERERPARLRPGEVPHFMTPIRKEELLQEYGWYFGSKLSPDQPIREDILKHLQFLNKLQSQAKK